MSDNRSVSGRVEVSQDERSSVAFKLMQLIAEHEYNKRVEDQKSRDYWLKLYRQCYKATHGSPMELILKEG